MTGQQLEQQPSTMSRVLDYGRNILNNFRRDLPAYVSMGTLALGGVGVFEVVDPVTAGANEAIAAASTQPTAGTHETAGTGTHVIYRRSNLNFIGLLREVHYIAIPGEGYGRRYSGGRIVQWRPSTDSLTVSMVGFTANCAAGDANTWSYHVYHKSPQGVHEKTCNTNGAGIPNYEDLQPSKPGQYVKQLGGVNRTIINSIAWGGLKHSNQTPEREFGNQKQAEEVLSCTTPVVGGGLKFGKVVITKQPHGAIAELVPCPTA